MSTARLSALDASFLHVESPTAHMHVGWIATFEPPAGRPAPTFEELFEHISSRLSRAPRYRQCLAQVPFGVHDPEWVDDAGFDPAQHIMRARSSDVAEIADTVMSVPLQRDRPLWEIWLAEPLLDGRIAMVGKAHHCMVDGIAAVELASLLLDPESDSPRVEPADWSPARRRGPLDRLASGVLDRAREQIELATMPVRALRSPQRIPAAAAEAGRAVAAVTSSLTPATTETRFNEPSSPLRHLAVLDRPLDDLRTIKRAFDTTLNDAVLAVCAGGMRSFLEDRGEEPVPLKTMVPVNVRNGAAGPAGNHISFIFVELPCQIADPVERLYAVNRDTGARKRARQPQGGDLALKAVSYAPRTVQSAVSRMTAGPRAFNLTISNIPGPQGDLYLRGCRLRETYPVVPLSDGHALSIGLTTTSNRAFFGLYADRERMPDADDLADAIDESVDELLALAA